jgi:hypothetical protein
LHGLDDVFKSRDAATIRLSCAAFMEDSEVKNHQLINQNSANVEIFTPPNIILAAHRTMGGIDIDPASCDAANKIVGAKRFFTKEDDGILKEWNGKAWLNHPFGRAEKACLADCQKKHNHHDYELYGNARWINKLLAEIAAYNVSQACCICFAATSEKWFQPLLRYPQCFLFPRTNYLLPNGTVYEGVTKGSVVTYFGHNQDAFKTHFSPLGTVK